MNIIVGWVPADRRCDRPRDPASDRPRAPAPPPLLLWPLYTGKLVGGTLEEIDASRPPPGVP